MRIYIIIFLLIETIPAQVVPTADSLRLLQKRIVSVEIMNIGASMPIKEFGSRDRALSSGFAIPGLKLDAGLNIQIYKHLAIKGQVMWQNNPIDEAKYKKDLEFERSSNSYTVSSGGWNNWSIFIGALGNFEPTEDIHIQPFIMGGFALGASPLITVNVTDSLGTNYTILQKRGTGINFCYSGGLDVKFDVGNNFQFITGINGFYATIKFKNAKVENAYQNSYYEFDAVQDIRTLGFKIGMAKLLR